MCQFRTIGRTDPLVVKTKDCEDPKCEDSCKYIPPVKTPEPEWSEHEEPSDHEEELPLEWDPKGVSTWKVSHLTLGIRVSCVRRFVVTYVLSRMAIRNFLGPDCELQAS